MKIEQTVLPPEVQAGLDTIDRLLIKSFFGVLNRLARHASSAQLAKRFSKNIVGAEGGVPTYVNRTMRGLTEEAYKREQLRRDIENIKLKFKKLQAMQGDAEDAESEFKILRAMVKLVHLDLEASKREFQPEPVR